MSDQQARDLKAGIRRSISHLRESYQRADDLVEACERWELMPYLDLAYTEGATHEQLNAAMVEVVNRLEVGEATIRKLDTAGTDTARAEDKWLTLMNCYVELAEASFRP